MFELGIVETRNIINAIADKYNYDFTDYALTSFKQRLERIIDQNNIKYAEIFIEKVLQDNKFFETILNNIEVPSTEMFRDPSIWRIIRDDLLPSFIKEGNNDLKVWIPNSVSGDELFSLCIVLQEMGILNNVQILVSSLSNKSIQTIKSGIMANSKIEISTDNYVRFNGKNKLSDYYTLTNGEVVRDVTLLKNVTYYKQEITLDRVPQGVRLVLFRNKMIYFNQTLQSRIVKLLYNDLPAGAILIIGVKESLNNFFGTHEFSLIYSSESIYKRK